MYQTASQLGTPVDVQVAADLIQAYRARADQQALRGLVVMHLPRIRAMAKRFDAAHADDLTAEGVIALLEALERHVPHEGVPFIAHALPVVRGAMIRANSKISRVLSLPDRALRDAQSGRLEGARAEMLLRALDLEDFDETVVGVDTFDAEDLTLARERRRHLRRAVAGALRALSRQERRLIVHHVLHEEKSLELLAQELGLPLARARMIEGRALHKMRNTLMKNGFELSDLV